MRVGHRSVARWQGKREKSTVFFKHLTNIPKWLIAQKKSGKKTIGTENSFRKSSPSPTVSPAPPSPARLFPLLFGIRD